MTEGEGRRPEAPAAPAADPVPPSDASGQVDAGRRAFFLELGKQAVSAVSQVAGMADMASRSASSIAGELLGLDEGRPPPAFTRSGDTTDPVVSAAAPAADDVFRSAYRLGDEGLVLLDQRSIPEALDEVVARRGSDVAYYLRLGVARGGPVMAQVAAYGLALTAAERAAGSAEARALELRRTGQALVDARPSAWLVRWAVERMQASVAAIDAGAGAEVAQVLRAEAEAIAQELTAAQAAIAATIAEILPQPEGRPLGVLLHGSQGALAGGLVGTGVAALARLRDEGRELQLYVTEGRPFMDGARLASWELRQRDLKHRIIPDAAVAWLLEREPLDAVLVSAEWVASNGDVGALVGSRGIAGLVASGVPDQPRPRLIVSGPEATRDADTTDGSAIPEELRPPRDLTAYLADVPIRGTDALVPAADVIPAGAIDAFVTENGVSRGAET